MRVVEEGARIVLYPETLAAKLRMVEGMRGSAARGTSMTDALLEDGRLERERVLREEVR